MLPKITPRIISDMKIMRLIAALFFVGSLLPSVAFGDGAVFNNLRGSVSFGISPPYANYGWSSPPNSFLTTQQQATIPMDTWYTAGIAAGPLAAASASISSPLQPPAG